jgi:subtilase family serine protease
MQRRKWWLGSAAVLLCGLALFAQAPSAPARGHVIVPTSSIPVPGRPVTHLLIFVPGGAPVAQSGPPSTAETPASLACVYKLTKQVKGCPIDGTTAVPTGGAKAIAVVEVGDDLALQSDLDGYSETFGLPKTTLKIVCVGSGGCSDQGWGTEMALDTQIAHAMAPKAKIYVVECAGSCTNQEMLDTEKKAGQLVAAAGGGEVSNSWGFGGGEFSGETQYDKYFRHKGVVYFASSGDSPAVYYPSASPNVVSSGGTTINRDSSGNFTGESAWGGCGGGAGGGYSQEESRPVYQDIIKKIVGNHRGTPDVSFDANPCSGVAILDTWGYGGWVQVGGTSVSSPALAGIFNSTGHFYESTAEQLTAVYKDYGIKKEYHSWFRDIESGSNGVYNCIKGYDLCSGVGSSLTYKGK